MAPLLDGSGIAHSIVMEGFSGRPRRPPALRAGALGLEHCQSHKIHFIDISNYILIYTSMHVSIPFPQTSFSIISRMFLQTLL